MNRAWAAVSSVLLFAIHIASAHAINLIVNGSFEEGAFIGTTNTSWNSISVGETAVTGWIAGTNGFDWHQAVEFSPAYDGYRMVDLTLLSSDGAISQTFTTVAGGTYSLTFAVTAPGTSFDSPTLDVSVGNAASSYTISRSPEFALSWALKTLSFQATSNLTTLTFSGHASGAFWGPVIDNVLVTAAIPEPETYAMMLAGLGLLGLVARRREQ